MLSLPISIASFVAVKDGRAVPVTDHQQTAKTILLAALRGDAALRSKEGQFLGGVAFDANPLTDKQANWLAILADRYGTKGGAA